MADLSGTETSCESEGCRECGDCIRRAGDKIWQIKYHRMGKARLNPAVCICGLDGTAVIHNEPPHAFRSSEWTWVICHHCDHHENSPCHVPEGPSA